MLFFPLTSVCVMLVLPAMQALRIKEGMVKRGVTFISRISYAMYLLNYSIVVQVIKITAYSDAYAPALYAIYWIATIGLSILLYRYVEKPFLKFRDRNFNDRPIKTQEDNVYAVDTRR